MKLKSKIATKDEQEIKEFISKTIEQIKAALPNGFALDSKLDFNISLITTKKDKGGIDIKLAVVGRDYETQQVHNVRFSIINEKSQKKANEEALNFIRKFVQDIVSIDKKQNIKEINLKKSKMKSKKE